jgi:hypothetical protein
MTALNDDDINEDAEKVDAKTDEDWFLTLSNSNAPHQASQKQDIVQSYSFTLHPSTYSRGRSLTSKEPFLFKFCFEVTTS